MVRIVSGGIFMSTDGGQSWKTGVTGRGINTSYLTTGQINTNEIYISAIDVEDAAFEYAETDKIIEDKSEKRNIKKSNKE